MAEDDPFRLARAPAGEQDHRFLAIPDGRDAEHRGQDAPRQENEDAPEDDFLFQRRQYLLDAQRPLRPWKIRQPLDDGAGADDLRDARDADRGLGGGASGGEVEIHRHLAGEREGDIRDDRRAPRRQDDGHAPAGQMRARIPAQDDRSRQQAAARGHAAVHAIGHRGVELAALEAAQAGLCEVAAKDRPALVRPLAQDQQPLPHERDIRRIRRRSARRTRRSPGTARDAAASGNTALPGMKTPSPRADPATRGRPARRTGARSARTRAAAAAASPSA